MDIHVYIHSTSEPKLDQIIALLNTVLTRETTIMATIDDVQSSVNSEKTVIDSAVTLLNNLTAMLQAAQNTGDPAKVQAVIDSITAQTQELAAAVQANTPAAPPAPTPAP
jgi:hypothetical protein